MANADESAASGRRWFGSPEGTALFLFVGALAIGALLWTRPRPFVPANTPGLRLTGPGPQTGMTSDPASHSELALETDARVREAGAAERAAAEGTLTQDARGLSEAATEAGQRLHDAEGASAITALRNSMTAEAVDTLLGERAPSDEANSLLGAFEHHLERYGARLDGSIRAPRIVLEAMFKARWNSIVSRDATDGMHPQEKQAYWGWLAFEAHDIEPGRRLEAMDAYEEAGGVPVPEARALLLHLSSRSLEAVDLLHSVQSNHQNLRLRNIALAMVDGEQ